MNEEQRGHETGNEERSGSTSGTPSTREADALETGTGSGADGDGSAGTAENADGASADATADTNGEASAGSAAGDDADDADKPVDDDATTAAGDGDDAGNRATVSLPASGEGVDRDTNTLGDVPHAGLSAPDDEDSIARGDGGDGGEESSAGGVRSRSLEDWRERGLAAKAATPDADATEARREPTSFAVVVPLRAEVLTGPPHWDAFEQMVRDMPPTQRQLVALDCSALTRVDSTGIGLLVLLADIVQGDGGRMVLVEVPAGVANVIRTLGMGDTLIIGGSLGNLASSAASTGETGVASELQAVEGRLRNQIGSTSQALDTIRAELRQMLAGPQQLQQQSAQTVSDMSNRVGTLARGQNTIQHYIGEIAQRLSAFEQHLNKLTNYFNDRFRQDKTKDKAFDTLHEELKQYRNNFVFQSQKPVFKDLILLHDDVRRMIDSIGDDPVPAEDARKRLDLLREMVLEILYRRDVEVMDDCPPKFDANQQKALKREQTTDAAQDWTIKEVVREGFRWGDRVLRPQEVIVYRHDPSGDEATTAPDVAATAAAGGDADTEPPPDAALPDAGATPPADGDAAADGGDNDDAKSGAGPAVYGTPGATGDEGGEAPADDEGDSTDADADNPD